MDSPRQVSAKDTRLNKGCRVITHQQYRFSFRKPLVIREIDVLEKGSKSDPSHIFQGEIKHIANIRSFRTFDR